MYRRKWTENTLKIIAESSVLDVSITMPRRGMFEVIEYTKEMR